MSDNNFSHPGLTPFDEEDDTDYIKQFNNRKNISSAESYYGRENQKGGNKRKNKKVKTVFYLKNGRRQSIKVSSSDHHSDSDSDSDGYPSSISGPSAAKNDISTSEREDSHKSGSPFEPVEDPESELEAVTTTSGQTDSESKTDEDQEDSSESTTQTESKDGDDEEIGDENQSDEESDDIIVFDMSSESDLASEGKNSVLSNMVKQDSSKLTATKSSDESNPDKPTQDQPDEGAPPQTMVIKRPPIHQPKSSLDVNDVVKRAPGLRNSPKAAPKIGQNGPRGPLGLPSKLPSKLPNKPIVKTPEVKITKRKASIEITDENFDMSNKYEKMGLVGEGSFGQVYKVKEKETGNIYACKIIDIVNSDEDLQTILKEISFLNDLVHPNITKLHRSFINEKTVWIVMEYINRGSGREILDRLCLPGKKAKGLSEALVAVICREMLNGLVHIHEKNLIHRDLKAANVLFTSNGDVKLADFGVSGKLDNLVNSRMTFVGTPYWMAPETIKQDGTKTSADIWSLGITAMEFANGIPPLDTIHPMRAIFKIINNEPPVLKGKRFSDEFKEFIAACLVKNPLKRPSAKQLLSHPFIKGAGKKKLLATKINKLFNFKSVRIKPKRSSRGAKKSNGDSTSLDSLMSSQTMDFDVSYNAMNTGTVIKTNEVNSPISKNMEPALDGYESFNMGTNYGQTIIETTKPVKVDAKAKVVEQSSTKSPEKDQVSTEASEEQAGNGEKIINKIEKPKLKRKKLVLNVPKVITNLLPKSKRLKEQDQTKASPDQLVQSIQENSSETTSGKISTTNPVNPSGSGKPMRLVLNLPGKSSDLSLRTSIKNGQKSSSPIPVLKLPQPSLASSVVNSSANKQDGKFYLNGQELDKSKVKYGNAENKLSFAISLKTLHKTAALPWILKFPDNLQMDRFDDVIGGKFQVTIKSPNNKNLDCLGVCSWMKNKITVSEVKIFEGKTSHPKTILPNTLPDDIVIKYSRKKRS